MVTLPRRLRSWLRRMSRRLRELGGVMEWGRRSGGGGRGRGLVCVLWAWGAVHGVVQCCLLYECGRHVQYSSIIGTLTPAPPVFRHSHTYTHMPHHPSLLSFNRYLNARLCGLKRIFFTGNFLRHNDIAIRTLSYSMARWSKLSGHKLEALYLAHEGFLGALGAVLANYTAHETEDGSPCCSPDGRS